MSAVESLRVMASRSGVPTLVAGDRYLHSAYDPVREARREVEAVVADRPQMVVILGMGLGYSLDAVLELLPAARVLVVEADEVVHRLARETRTLPDDPRVSWLLGRRDKDAFESLSAVIDPVAAVGTRYLARLADRDPDYYGRIVETIGRIATMHVAGLESMAALGPLWWENSVRNVGAWCAAPDVGAWFGPRSAAGQPVFVFAAGPTLGDSLPVFARGEGGIRFVVDTAYETVARAGVRIDAVFAIDAQAQTLAHFAHRRAHRLVAAPVVPPPLWNRADVALLTSLDGPHFTWWDAALGRPVARLKSGGSVTTFAFDLARRMGPEAILLVGADFAHRGRRRHVGGTSYEAAEVSALRRFESLERLARRENFVAQGHATEPVMTQYAQWMTWEIAATSRPVYRMSRFGLLDAVPVAASSLVESWLDRGAPTLPDVAPNPVRTSRERSRVRDALSAERAALGRALAGGDEHLASLSGFFDLILRPWAVATVREGFTPEMRTAIRERLAAAAAVMDDVLSREFP